MFDNFFGPGDESQGHAITSPNGTTDFFNDANGVSRTIKRKRDVRTRRRVAPKAGVFLGQHPHDDQGAIDLVEHAADSIGLHRPLAQAN